MIGELKVWDIDDSSAAIVLRGHEHKVSRVAVSPDGKLLASGDASGQVRLWRKSGQLIRVLQTSGGQSWGDKLKGVAFVNDGKQLVIADEQQLTWWDLATGRQVFPPPNSGDDSKAYRGAPEDTPSSNSVKRDYNTRILSMTASPSGKSLGYHTRGQAYVLESDIRKEIFSVSEKASRVVIGPDDKQVALTFYHDRHGEMKTFDLASGREGIHVETEMIGSLFRTGYGLTNATFSPDGKRVVGVGNNGPAMVWDSRSGALLHELTGHSGFIWAVAYCPDGTRIVTGSTDGTIKLWDAESGREMITMRGHDGSVTDLAFSPNGKQLISVGNDKTVRIWNADLTGEVKQLTPEADGGMASVQDFNWNTPTDRDSRRQLLWGRDRMLALQAYEKWIRDGVAVEVKRRYSPHTDRGWPSKEETREAVLRGLVKEQAKVREVFGRDGEQVIAVEELDRELESVFERQFNEVYEKRFLKVQQDYKRLSDELREKEKARRAAGN